MCHAPTFLFRLRWPGNRGPPMRSVEPVLTPPIAVQIPILERNLGALARGSPDAASRIRIALPRTDAGFVETDDGVPAVELRPPGRGAVALCSRRRPIEEARRLIAPVDVAGSAIFVVLGFGAGHHVAELARRVGKSGLILVFEPDVQLLRAVLERIDHTPWMDAANVAILTDPDDAGAIAAAIQGLEGLLALGMNADAISGRAAAAPSTLADLGVTQIAHPPSQDRIADAAGRFCATLLRVAESVRMTVATSLVQVDTTMRNLFLNIDRYALGRGAASLAGTCRGRAAVVVSAGPSLERNIALLAQPGVRDRVVIIAVQTALKTLLSRGIRPHFVTALDHSAIGTRFYEGLSAADVEGVTLVIEPKVNPAIPEAFPGDIISVDDKYLDLLLGPQLTPHRRIGETTGAVPPGATVAHLAYYLARFMGCEPVALVGQDLGFTDGQYYASGAAIHDTWAGELNEFNTLEMLEWQRIKRMGSHLRPAADAHGRPVYTDEQMNTYRVQFERDFKADLERGLRVFDCTEGGVAKGHARACTLREFLDSHARSTSAEPTPHAPRRTDDAGAASPPSRQKVVDQMRSVRRDIWRIGEASREAAVLLSEMAEHHQDQARVNRLIHRVYALRDEVQTLEPAFTLIQAYNQRGGLDRVKADRAINLDAALPPLVRQQRQIERDSENVRKLATSADALGAMLDDSIRALDNPTRSGPRAKPASIASPVGARRGTAKADAAKKVRTGAFVWLDALSTPWAARELCPGITVLGATLRRLAQCREIESITVLCENEPAARAAAGAPAGNGPAIDFLAGTTDAGAPGFVRSARALARECWRGGLGGASIFDEALAPAPMLLAMERLELDAALVVGGNWPMIDPALSDELVRRHAQSPESHRFTFTQAAPGLAGCVVSRKLMGDLSRLRSQAGVLGTLGAMLTYLPPAPVADPIALPACIPIDTALRDAGTRFVVDSASSLDLLSRAASTLGSTFDAAPAGDIVSACRAAELAAPPAGPAHFQLLLGAPGHAPWREAAISQCLALRDDAAITIAGALRRASGQPREEVLLDPGLPALVRAARSHACRAVHVRSGLRAGPEQIDSLLAENPDVISVDLLAETPGVYGAVAGEDAMALAWAGIEHVLRRRGNWPLGDAPPGAWRGWLVPRMTKCDASYPEMERFYDRWIMLCGCAVIDPLAAPVEGQRIAPLRTPRSKQMRDARTILAVQPNGEVLGPDGAAIGNLSREAVGEVWARLWNARRGAGLI